MLKADSKMFVYTLKARGRRQALCLKYSALLNSTNFPKKMQKQEDAEEDAERWPSNML